MDNMYGVIPVCLSAEVCHASQWDEFGGKLMDQANQTFKHTLSCGDDATTLTAILDVLPVKSSNNLSIFVISECRHH